MHIPFVRVVIFEFLAQFPVDHLADPVVILFTPPLADGFSLIA